MMSAGSSSFLRKLLYASPAFGPVLARTGARREPAIEITPCALQRRFDTATRPDRWSALSIRDGR